MKITIRKNIFETNSSSTHSLILTNKEDLEKDLDKERNNKEEFYPSILCYDKFDKKEDKILFLGGLFDYELINNDDMQEEYDVFIKLLKDQKEDALIEQLIENQNEFKKYPYDEPYCRNFFCHGVLTDCTCCFQTKFKNYFKIEISYSKIFLELSKTNNDLKMVFDEKVKNEILRQKEQLYQKLYNFIYHDGIIVAYDNI